MSGRSRESINPSRSAVRRRARCTRPRRRRESVTVAYRPRCWKISSRYRPDPTHVLIGRPIVHQIQKPKPSPQNNHSPRSYLFPTPHRQNAQAVGIKEDIDDLVKNNPCHSVSLGEFRTLMADRGVGDASAQDETLEILQKAGVIVKLDDVVYTNPGQLTRDVLAVLPKVPSYVYGVSDTELESLEADLAAQEAEVSAAAGKARWRSNAVVGSGLAFMVTQFVVFLRLTYVELSWDVMEPISYFAGVFNAILVYIYFMVYKRDFSFDDWSSRMQASYTESAISKKGIDFEKYKKIARKLRKVP